MSEQEEDFAAMFEASVKARRFERGQTVVRDGQVVGPLEIEALEALGHPADARGESLSPADWRALWERLCP